VAVLLSVVKLNNSVVLPKGVIAGNANRTIGGNNVKFFKMMLLLSILFLIYNHLVPVYI